MTKSSVKKREQSFKEEIINSITHGVGFFLSIAGLSILVILSVHKGDPWKITAFSIYGATLIIMFLNSTLYHGITHSKIKHFFQKLDHSSIFILIAGTYTAITLTAMRGTWGWTLFGIIWGLAISGIIFKLIFFGRYKKINMAIYLIMGWMILIAIKPLILMVPSPTLLWIIIGGLFYTIGTIFYAWQSLSYNHVIWHVFVLGGSVSHFIGMLYI